MVKVIVAFLVGVTISACVANQFPYFYYTLDSDSYLGNLRGPTEADDVPLKTCMPNDLSRAPCVVMFTSAFLRLKEDYIKTKQDLIALQRECQ